MKEIKILSPINSGHYCSTAWFAQNPYVGLTESAVTLVYDIVTCMCAR